MQVIENQFASFSRDNVQYTWTDKLNAKVKSLHNKKVYQMFLKKNTMPQGYFFRRRNKDWTTNNIGKNLRYRHMSTYSQNSTLTRLEESYRILEKNISSLIVKELKKQFKLKPHERVWITEPLIENSIDLQHIFKIWIPKLVHLRQFLTSLRVAMEFIPTLSLDLDLESNLEFKSSINKLNQKLNDQTIKNEEIVSCLKQIQEEAEKFHSNFNKISIKAFCKYPQEKIYNTRNEPEYIVRDYVKNLSKWDSIFKDIDIENIFNSLVHKIHAIDLLYKTSGKYTPGIDNVKFWKPIHVTKTKIKQYKNLAKLKTRTPDQQKLFHNLYIYLIDSIKTQHPALKLQSIAKGKNNHAIQRKGSTTTPSEIARSTLNATWLGKQIKSLANRETKLIRKNPLEYIDKYNKLVKKFNTTIKFNLIYHTKFEKLKNFKSDPILRTYIPKTKSKLRPLGISTLKDRYVQKFMLIVMEPYLETCGDKNSWGFRPGRSTNLAITNLAQILAYNNNNPNNEYKTKLSSSFDIGRAKYKAKKKGIVFTKKYLQNVNTTTVSKPNYGKRSFKITVPTEFLSKKSNRKHYLTKYILDADIKGCFDNISHEWLLNNIPIPKNYKHLLFEILKTDIVEKFPTQYSFFDKVLKHLWLNWGNVKLSILNSEINKYKKILNFSENNAGIPQGGILSPVLMNWTLDGLSHVARIGSVTNENGEIVINKRNLVGRNYSTNLLQSTHLIRFADEFIFTSVTEQSVVRAKKSIETFLKERGLTLNVEKPQIIKWTMGKKLNFLGWTFHLISPNKVNWLTDLPKSISTRLKDRTKLFMYPSRESTKSFKTRIKNLLNLKNTNYTPQQMIKKLNPIIWGWSNYFLPSPNQYGLRSYLDHYIFKRCKQWIFKKYTKKRFCFCHSKTINGRSN
jgi:retron-type reverse transcriptase